MFLEKAALDAIGDTEALAARQGSRNEMPNALGSREAFAARYRPAA